MDIDTFWKLIDDAHLRSGGDMDVKEELLLKALQKLPKKDVQDFERHFLELERVAFNWPLYGAVYVMWGGCGCDGFMDFRKALISLGRKRFERAMSDPDSLADLNEVDVEALYTEMWGKFMGEILSIDDSSPWRPPPEMAGKEWDERTVKNLYPRLAARFK